MEQLNGMQILVVGLGRSGIPAAKAAAERGAVVTVQDSKSEEELDASLLASLREQKIMLCLGKIPEDVGIFDLVVLSPGVSPEVGFVQEAKARGAEIIGELELAYRIGHGNYIAITGTNGKTTTTTLVGEIFKHSGRSTHVVGNIGVAVVTASANATEEDWLVTECSSFQLETTVDFKPMVSAILNLTPDHLNRHHTMENYGQAKAKVFANQTEQEYLVINYDDPVCYALSRNCKAKLVPFSSKETLEFGAFVKEGELVIADETGAIHFICRRDELKIIGEHNLQNALAAAAVCYFAGINATVIGEAIRAFGGVEHRIEYAGTHKDVKYYNDSKGTNTDAAITALKAIGENIILIAGGDSKGQEFDSLVAEFPGRVKTMILLGRDAHFIAEAAEAQGFTNYVNCADMDACVAKAAEIAVPGDTVLLSPACASWDMYPSYEVRGDHFKQLVAGLE